jgi:hypothetical protein
MTLPFKHLILFALAGRRKHNIKMKILLMLEAAEKMAKLYDDSKR